MILFLFQVGENSIPVLSGSKMIGLGLSESKIDPKRKWFEITWISNKTWLSECISPCNLANEVYETFAGLLENGNEQRYPFWPSKNKWIQEIEVKWSKWTWTAS